MKKDIPLFSQLIRAIILEDYITANDIVDRKDFNPNEANESWGAPILTSIICVVSTTDKIKNKEALKGVIKKIVSHNDFNPNFLDKEGETVIMHIARHKDFNWLVPFIINTKKVDVSIKNLMKRDVFDIAEYNGNAVIADILLPLRIQNYKGQPKKRPGIKKTNKTNVVSINSGIIERIENSFWASSKKNPVSFYNLLMSFIKGEYGTCIQIVKDPNFNPNECNRWEEPVLTSLMHYSQDKKIKYDENMFKRIAIAIVNNKRFDVNTIDSDCNTVLMVAMGYPDLKWLIEMLFRIQSARLDIINDNGEAIRQIADKCGNGAFYDHLIKKSFELAEVVD